MELLLFIFISCLLSKVNCINFTISEDKVLKDDSAIITMSCQMTETDVETVYLIQIRGRKSVQLSGMDNPEWETLVFMEPLSNEIPTLSLDIVEDGKDFIAGGFWDSTFPTRTLLSLSMNITKIECADSMNYKCEVAYKSNITSAVKNPEINKKLSVYVKPRVTSLTGRKNGLTIHGPTASDMAVFNIGDELQLSCTAYIGSFPETKIRYYRSYMAAPNDEFVEYQPGVDTVDEGNAISDNECGYIRTGHINYVITANDTRRANRLAFECYVKVNGHPYGSFTTQTNPRFYLYIDKTIQPISSTSAENLTVTTDDIIASENENSEQILSIGIILGIAAAAFVVGVAVTFVTIRIKDIVTVNRIMRAFKHAH